MGSNSRQNASSFRGNLNNDTEFANSAVKRDIINGMNLSFEKDGNQQPVSAREFMAFLGYLGDGIKTDDPIVLTDDIINEMNDQSKGYVKKGLERFEDMIAEINQGNITNLTKFKTKGEEKMYSIAQQYVNDLEQLRQNRAAQQRGNNSQQQVI